MSVLLLKRSKSFTHPEKYDPDDQRYYSLGWRPPARQNNYEYLLDELVIPSPANGFYYQCVKPGRSGVAAPVSWATEIDALTTDGTVSWQAKPYNLELRDGDTVTSTWNAPTGVVLDNPGGDGSVNWVRVTSVPSGTTSFKLTNRVTITRLDGKVEILDGEMTIIVKG